MKKNTILQIGVALVVLCTIFIIAIACAAIRTEIEKLRAESALWKEAFVGLVWTGKEVVFKPTKTVETNKDMVFEDFAVRAYAGAYADRKVKEEKLDTMTIEGNQLWKKSFDEGMGRALREVSLLKKE